MSSIDDSDYLENMSRPKGHLPPTGLMEHLYPELKGDVDVYLIVIRRQAPRGKPMEARDQHWMFQWGLGETKDRRDPAYRRMHVVQEGDLLGLGQPQHLTNWGPMTVAGGKQTAESGVPIVLKSMTLEERKVFESIAATTRVRKPDGEWNCQNWCKTVLETAIERGILTREAVDQAIAVAEAVEPVVQK